MMKIIWVGKARDRRVPGDGGVAAREEQVPGMFFGFGVCWRRSAGSEVGAIPAAAVNALSSDSQDTRTGAVAVKNERRLLPQSVLRSRVRTAHLPPHVRADVTPFTLVP
ncbi:hypothetical protein [Streptomyces cadmiisoli]|uniref:hypothetical protein n=1 Tax=Streptomyces cadmiisoli TaxID=2184053 RepID=UPI00365F785E